ncbi:hypothetical protein [Streptomyces mirabilis]|uniref:hypothetical protein n=1 Tax=Streptomyces mirabilis TaxID=68239 RepID=UPI0036D7B956
MTTAPAGTTAPITPEYGDRVIAVETAGSEPIPDAERHGSPLQLLWTWPSPNIEFATVYIGVISVLFFGINYLSLERRACTTGITGCDAAFASSPIRVLPGWGRGR